MEWWELVGLVVCLVFGLISGILLIGINITGGMIVGRGGMNNFFFFTILNYLQSRRNEIAIKCML